MTTLQKDAIAQLSAETGRVWTNTSACAAAAIHERAHVADLARKLIPADCSFLTFGSLARDELTKGSDRDWALLIDGAAHPRHLDVAKELAKLLGDKPPGPTNVFGCPVFSHDLVHLIGGEADTNSNTTRRILLLLESRALVEHAGVRERVVRHLLHRYVEEDRGYHASHDYSVRVPLFLLNDIVRFWRTMTVDYANKRRERDGWAIRNVKLRISRKLVYVAGLAMCMSCQVRPSEALKKESFASEQDFTDALQDFLFEFSNRTPLQVLARFALDVGATSAAADCFDAYDAFLAILADEDKRTRLKTLEADGAHRDEVFKHARGVGTAFQDGLTKLFFESDKDLTSTIQRYGVF
jgi:predicted nucleotidyltransferase